MHAMIRKMRADWPIIAEARRACGDWTAEDEEEFHQAIVSAVARENPDEIALWARWLADLSAIEMGLRVIGVLKRMKEQAAKAKQEPTA